MAWRVSGSDDAVRAGPVDRPSRHAGRAGRSGARRRERPHRDGHLRGEQLARPRGEAHGPQGRRRGRGGPGAGGDRRVGARYAPGRRLCAGRRGAGGGRPHGAARHGLRAEARGAGGAFPRRGRGHAPAHHALQQPARLSGEHRGRRAARPRGRAQHRRRQGERAGSAPLHRPRQHLRRPVRDLRRPRRHRPRRADARRQGLGCRA